MIHFKSVKFRLTVWYAFVLTVILSAFAFLMYAELSRVLYADADKNLLFKAESIEGSLAAYIKEGAGETGPGDDSQPLGFFLFSQKTAGLKAVDAVRAWEKANQHLGRSTLMIRLMTLENKVAASNLKGWEKEIIFPDFERDAIFMEKGKSFQTIHFQKKPIRLYYHLLRVGRRPVFIIQCGISIHEVESTLSRLAVIILVSIPGAVAAACWAGWFMAKRSFRPLEQMNTKARQITAAYLKDRLPRTKTGDELDRLAETLNEMMDRIELSTRSIQEFSTNISHELKTPLAIIRGEVDLALRRPRSAEALVETLRVIQGEVDELTRLVEDLLLLVRSDAGQIKFVRIKLSLNSVMEYVSGRFQKQAGQKKVSLAMDLGEDLYVLGDDIYLKRLFSNLVDNAIKFTPEGGRVVMRLSRAGEKARAEVIDTGIGIASEKQSRIFSRFYRTDEARSFEGSGLGLNIAKAICEAHGGMMSLESRLKEGTRIIVQFPAVFSS